jgi:hypothetical protein
MTVRFALLMQNRKVEMNASDTHLLLSDPKDSDKNGSELYYLIRVSGFGISPSLIRSLS